MTTGDRQFVGPAPPPAAGPTKSGPRSSGLPTARSSTSAASPTRLLAWSEETGGGFSMIDHTIPPRRLVAPVHRHTREDEYSFVLDGRFGVLLGNDVVLAEPGSFVFKPRDQWHTHWNAGDEPCRIVEVISPGGFEAPHGRAGDGDRGGRGRRVARLGVAAGVDRALRRRARSRPRLRQSGGCARSTVSRTG